MVDDEFLALWLGSFFHNRLTIGSSGDNADVCQAFKEKKILVSIRFDSLYPIDGLFAVARPPFPLLLQAFALVIFI